MISKIEPFKLKERKKVVRILFILILIFEIYLYYSNTLLYQLKEPVLKLLDLDITYYIFHFLKIPETIINNSLLSLSFDLILFFLIILIIIFPLKRFLILTYLILFFIYLITRNSYGVFHEHLFNGVIFAVFPFIFKSNLTTKYLWEFTRYLHLFIYFSAFLWKIGRFSFFDSNQLSSIIELNLTSYMLENPKTYFTYFYKSILLHPYLLFLMGLMGLLFEALFLIGFFTKKYDSYLFFLGIFIHCFFWIFADAFYFPILLISLSLLNFNKITHRNA
jgi:hypothetical protein